MLKSSHNVEFAYTFGKTKIELKNYDRFKYQHVIVMGLSTKGINFFTKNLQVKSKLMILSPISMKEEMSSLLVILILINRLENCSMLSELILNLM